MLKQVAQHLGDRDLPRLAAHIVDARIEGGVRALQRLDREAAGDEAGGEHTLAREQRVEGDGGRDLRPIDEGEPFLGAKVQRLQLQPLQRFGGGHDLAVEGDPALAEHRGGEVGEGGEIARGADRALRRHARDGVPLQHVEQAIDDEPTHARMAPREADHLHRQDESHDGA